MLSFIDLIYIFIIFLLMKFYLNFFHLLNSLLILEFISLFFYLMFSMNIQGFNFESTFMLYFLIMVVCEGVLGLCLLVLMSMTYSTDYLFSFNKLLC